MRAKILACQRSDPLKRNTGRTLLCALILSLKSHGLVHEERWEDMRNFVKGFRREDLRFTDMADFIVIKVDRDTHMCGSYDELFVAERQRKPLFCIIEGGIKELPTWLFGVFRLENIFSNVDDCFRRGLGLS